MSAEKTDLHSSSRSVQPAASIPPRLIEKALASDEPMVIEFSTSSRGGSAGSSIGTEEDEISVPRAGHKRARINSTSIHNDVVKQPCVKRPVTFHGKSAVLSYCQTSTIFNQG